MYTFVSLKQLIESLPIVEKREILKKFEGIDIDRVKFALEDIYDNLAEYDKKEFFENNLTQLGKDIRNLASRTYSYGEFLERINAGDVNSILSSIDDDVMCEYLRERGYDVDDDTYKSSREKLDSIDEDTIVEYLEEQGYTVKLFNTRI